MVFWLRELGRGLLPAVLRGRLGLVTPPEILKKPMVFLSLPCLSGWYFLKCSCVWEGTG